MKVRDRIGPICDLFLGAMYADDRFEAEFDDGRLDELAANGGFAS